MKPPTIKLIFGSAVLLIALAVAVRILSSGGIEVAHPVEGPAVQVVYETGTVEPTVMMPIAPRITARLMELNADEGADVKKDKVLARLEDENFRQALQEVKSREDYAQKNYERTTDLLKKGYVSKDALDRAQSEWEAAKAASAKAETEAGFMKLMAPADGKIIRRDGEVGQLIPANQPVFWLSCCAPLRVSAEVDEEDISEVKPDQKVFIRADAFPGQVFEGKVQAITPKGDPVARSYRVRIEFAGETPFLIGMTAETNIVIRETQNAMLVPTSAVQGNIVWLPKDGRLAKAEVTVGAKGTEQTEILSGLSFDDYVVAKPGTSLKEGKRVSVNKTN